MVAAKVSLREELIFLLNQATELEHSLCCSYLFTAFSLKSKVEEGVPPELLPDVKRWKQTFFDIAIEEMFHLTLINDLLVAVGSAPNLDRPNFPHGCSYYMPDLHIELHPFSEETLRHFVAVEQPSDGDLPLRQNPALMTAVLGDMDNEIGPDPHILASQGDVYDIALEGIKAMIERIGEESVFIGPAASTALEKFLTGSGWEPMRSLAATERALARIVEEGEGGAGGSENSHHHRFNQVLQEFLASRERHPGFDPAFPVLANPFARTPPESTGIVNLLDDELAIQISDLFNEVYTAMLHLLARFFVVTGETEEEATKLFNAALMVMTGVLGPLGEALVRLPAGGRHPGMHAGPSFVVGTLHPLPFKDAAWFVLRERFSELKDYTDRLASENTEVTQRLKSVSGTLGRIVKSLG